MNSSRPSSMKAFAFFIVTLAVCVLSPPARGQTPSPADLIAKSPNPDLIGALTKELSITPQQATGGAGSLFGLAKSKLSAVDFSKLSKSVPGMDGLLKAAPKPKSNSPLDSLESSLPGSAGGLASVAGAFKSLGLTPATAEKFVPVMTKYVENKGGSSVASLLSSVLK